ncbi:hypothetical protein SODALDRAFT_332502 [Sodiomyces alkalinus F11]|uniref:Uncharacterized protein n=1 Tax=Sodiomyces alkalinus (strain CBS 110278 / VKM F-3762 / F11) TaxID=1314773 RepID=A0A3N2PX22_SODAK|nr:hypothetical protein SODALDRAFT_332502 [Sodiomyces alkalinus F11]ROT39070.1 hypothetical protein SODALDRAFT_332502 [Sodiomyces alkalinus F11]
MLLFTRNDELHEELKKRAAQVQTRFEDMNSVPNVKGILRLPGLPAIALELVRFLYDRKREHINDWAKESGIRIHDKARLGPQVVWLHKVPVGANRLLISVVIPKPSQDKKTEAATQQAVIPQQNELRSKVRVKRPIAEGLGAWSLLDLEVGDVIILEGNEELLIQSSKNDTIEARGICLLSAQHDTCLVEKGKGGWAMQ